MRRTVLVALSLTLVLAAFGLASAQSPGEKWFDFPADLPPDEYGNILIDRISTANNVKPVSFSHWKHRLRYTCRVCHFELGFEFKTNATEITEKLSGMGYYCGACHDGVTAFAHSESNCNKCHNGDLDYNSKKIKDVLNALPGGPYGNNIDWVKSYSRLKPAYSMFYSEQPLRFSRELSLEAELSNIPPAIFPHKPHVRELDCSNCHPQPFNIKKKTTEHFTMDYILDGQFCGACHMTVAFPVRDCAKCHKEIRTGG